MIAQTIAPLAHRGSGRRPTYISHPHASIAPSIRLTCMAVTSTGNDSLAIDCLMPLALASNLTAISRLIRKAIGGDWAVIDAVQTADCF